MNISKFISRLPGAKKNGKGWIALCPAHDDQHASLSVGIGDDGRILLKCFAGCDTDSIVKALGIHISDLFSNGAVQMNGQRKRDWPALAKIFSDALTPDRRAELAKVLGLPELALASLAIGWSEAEQCWTFPECNGQGQIIGINRRYRDGQKKAIAGSKRGLTVPENWRQGEGPIFLPEGASNTLSLIALGLAAVGRPSNTGGVDHLVELFRPLQVKRPLIVLGDNDPKDDGKWPGRDGAAKIACVLAGQLPGWEVSWALPPDRAKDVRAWLVGQKLDPSLADAWNDAGELLPKKIESGLLHSVADESTDQSVAQPGAGMVIAQGEVPAYPWPDPPAAEAFHGLAGKFVRTLEPETESDSVALLIQFLIAFGNVIGRNAHFRVEGDYHYCNLFAVLVGETSKARKGTSWGRTRWLLEKAESVWASKRILSGLSSGEGLIWSVRDPVIGRNKIKGKGGRIESVEEYEEDPGEPDKRLLIFEPEFAVVLKQIERTGNTLSAIIRQLWERGDLRTLVSGRTRAPVNATGAHGSIIAHITIEELRRYLSTTEAASGFGNRFLWLCVRRSKCLPEGGNFVDLAPFVGRLSKAIAFAQSAGELRRDDDAREIWRKVYPSLSDGKPGLAGALMARGEAQTMRLACIYALLDESPVIQPEHLQAALALWEYCERSVRFIFGDSLGDDVADDILSALRRQKGEGMTRTDITNLFNRHQSTGRIAKALGLLQKFGLAEGRPVRDTGGRPSECWFACGLTAKKAS